MEAIKLETKNQEVALFGTTEKQIAEYAEKYKGLAISDTKTYESTKAARTEMVSLRTSIDKARKAADKPLREKLKEHKKEGDRLIDLVTAIEAPLQETVKAWEDKKAAEKAERERIEAARINGHKKVISIIRQLGNISFGESSNSIREKLDTLTEMVIDEQLEEFQQDAQSAFDTSKFMLESSLESAIEMEKQKEEAERIKAENERIQKENDKLKAEQEKIAEEQKRFDEKREADQKLKAAQGSETTITRLVDIQESGSSNALNDAENDIEQLNQYFKLVHSFAVKNQPELKTKAHINILNDYVEGLRV